MCNRELLSYREIVLETITQDAQALGFAAAELRSDSAIVLEVAQQDAQAFEYAAAELLPDSAIVLEVATQDHRRSSMLPRSSCRTATSFWSQRR